MRDSDERYPDSQRRIGGQELLFRVASVPEVEASGRCLWIHSRHIDVDDAGFQEALTNLHFPYYVKHVRKIMPSRARGGKICQTDEYELTMKCT